MKPELSTTPRSAEDRKQGLDNYLVKLLAIRNDAVILMRTDHQASIKTGKTPNHILHFLLCIPTLGFWVIIWILISMSNKVRTDLVSVDEFGNIHTPYGNYF
jgi:hypothetical protein